MTRNAWQCQTCWVWKKASHSWCGACWPTNCSWGHREPNVEKEFQTNVAEEWEEYEEEDWEEESEEMVSLRIDEKVAKAQSGSYITNVRRAG